jgi:hypothetical protein
MADVGRLCVSGLADLSPARGLRPRRRGGIAGGDSGRLCHDPGMVEPVFD